MHFSNVNSIKIKHPSKYRNFLLYINVLGYWEIGFCIVLTCYVCGLLQWNLHFVRIGHCVLIKDLFSEFTYMGDTRPCRKIWTFGVAIVQVSQFNLYWKFKVSSTSSLYAIEFSTGGFQVYIYICYKRIDVANITSMRRV